MIVHSEEDALEFARSSLDAKSASSRKQMKKISEPEKKYSHVVFNIGNDAKIARIIKTDDDLMVCREDDESEYYVILSQVPLNKGDDYFFISLEDARDDHSSSTSEEKGISPAVYGPITYDEKPVALRKVETGGGGDCFFSSFSKILEEIVLLEKSLPKKEQCVTSKLGKPLSTYVFRSHVNDADEKKSWIESRTSKEKSQAVRNICAQSFVQLANEQTKEERSELFASIMLHILTMDKNMDETVIDDVKSIFPSSLSKLVSTQDDPRESMISALTIPNITIQDTQFNSFRDWVASWICKMGTFHEGTTWDSHLLHLYFPNIKVITIAEKSFPYRFELIKPYELPGNTQNEQAARLLESVSEATHRAFIVYTHGFQGSGHYQTLLAQFLDEKRTIICKEELALSIVEEAWNNYRKKEFIRVNKQYHTLPLPLEFDNKILGVDLRKFRNVTNECYVAENLDKCYHKTQIQVWHRNKCTTKQITDMEIKSYSLMTKCINLLKPGRRVLMKLVPLSLLDNESNPYPFDTKVLQGNTWEEPQETQERMIIFTVERYMQVGVYDKNFVTCFAKDMRAYATHQFISETSDNLKNRAVFVGKLQIDKISRDFVCRTFVNASILMQGDPTQEPLNRVKCNYYLNLAQKTAPSSDGKQKIVVYL